MMFYLINTARGACVVEEDIVEDSRVEKLQVMAMMFGQVILQKAHH